MDSLKYIVLAIGRLHPMLSFHDSEEIIDPYMCDFGKQELLLNWMGDFGTDLKEKLGWSLRGVKSVFFCISNLFFFHCVCCVENYYNCKL